MKKGRYLITGCAGFIGSNLVKRIHKNYELILVDDLSEGSVSNLPKKLRDNWLKINFTNSIMVDTNTTSHIKLLKMEEKIKFLIKILIIKF